ncbi:tyrosine-type recombinase/integrase [Streptomyces sp. HU2014]|uniref:tyrosine-type recombinase/integrase n=1 Tax=Streptomyces sp. HU2014 TaxID=2939414 RepID=UPI00200E9D5A|nr:tyrosine-type recombinase/integrase [Streptomyces sp. HU2014]UQI45860.1 tyrosine-type recombinase/integrase [Streptomyces sp. HU2014]
MSRLGTTSAPSAGTLAWSWPVDLAHYDRHGLLTEAEAEALQNLSIGPLRRSGLAPDALPLQPAARLARPLADVLAVMHRPPGDRHQQRYARDAAGLILMRCGELRRAFWGWSVQDWVDLIDASGAEFRRSWGGQIGPNARPFVIVYAYLLGEFTAFDQLGRFQRLSLAHRVFGSERVDDAVQHICKILADWGYRRDAERLTSVICQVLLLNRSPLLEDLSTDALAALRARPAMSGQWGKDLYGLHRAVAALGHAEPPPSGHVSGPAAMEGVPAPWAGWVERWYATSTLTPKIRSSYRSVLAKIGRWLAAEHPETTEPGQWTRQTCAAWVAAVDRMAVGDFSQWTHGMRSQNRLGKPLTPETKSGYLKIPRAFFRDLHEWEWVTRRFDPAHALRTPRSVRALMGPDPRVIADDIWAKLLWAGLNVEPGDLPTTDGRTYPVELIRAITLTWLFAGQRSDEIARLRVGCIRWQHDGLPIPGDSGEILARDAVCLLDVPTHKTGTSFTKPVDPLLGQAIEAWQAVRPTQPPMLDPKTNEHADFLFAHRARRVAKHYINTAIIPMLCRKAGVPTADVRGNITSHRARSTIASQLYNAKEPMTLFELQEWLGHRTPEATTHYAKLTPNTLARAYNDAGYFERNVRTIEVLVDRDAVASGAAASGEPWQYFDLGHGWCTYTFFEQCQHRMACARCDFYTPKDSSKGQLLEAKENLQKMLASIPLTDDERAAVDDGQVALGHLLERLTDVPTPAGPTPRQIGVPATATLLPIVDVRQGKPGCS